MDHEEKFKKTIEEIFTHEELSDKKLDLVNIGAEKVIFRAEGVPNRVFKIPRDAFNRRIAFILRGEEIDKRECDKGVIGYQMNYWKDEMHLEDEAKGVFGAEHFLKRGIFRVTVPMTKSLLTKYLGEAKIKDIPDDFYEDIKILAESQEKLDVLINKEGHLPFAVFLVTVKDFCPSSDSTLEKGLSIIRTKLDEQIMIMEEMMADEHLQRVLKEIVQNIIRYTKQTGKMIDIFGRDNLVIFAKEGHIDRENDIVTDYDYKFIEFTLPGNKDHWMVKFEEDKKHGFEYMRHYYSYYYFIHKMGEKLGISDNLEPRDLYYFKG
jgi:hypothetical protein